MTGDLLALAALDAVFLVTGWLLVRGLGFRPHPLRPAWLGLAFFAGWAAVGIGASLAAMAGVPPRPLTVLVIAGMLAGASWLGHRREGRPETGSPAAGLLDHVAGLAGAGVVATAIVAAGIRALFRGADTNWDVWAFWVPKARSIYEHGGFDTGPGGFAEFANPEYPPLVPVQHAIAFGFMRTDSATLLPLQQVVLAGAFFCALAVILRKRVRPLLLWPALAMLAAAPTFAYYFESALADPVVAYTISLAGVAAVLWRLEGDRRWRDLTALLLATAALVKSEGFLLGLLLGALILVVALVERRSRLQALAVAATPVAAMVPWKIWLAAHGEALGSVNYSWGDIVRVGYLADRVDRLTYALDGMLGLLLAPSAWLVVVPAALLALLLAAPRQPAVAVIVGGWLGLGFFGLATVYWIGTPAVAWYVDTSAQRVLLSIGCFAGALLPLAVAEAVAGRDRDQRQPPVSPL